MGRPRQRVPRDLLADLARWRRPAAAAAGPDPPGGRHTGDGYRGPSAWHVVARRLGRAWVVESRGTRQAACARARQLAAGGLEADSVSVEKDGGRAVLILALRPGPNGREWPCA